MAETINPTGTIISGKNAGLANAKVANPINIKAAMQALPQQFRDVVYYFDVAGFRCNEIASIMNTPRGTVASRLRPSFRSPARAARRTTDCR